MIRVGGGATHLINIKTRIPFGHHYFPGLAMFPEPWQCATLAAHPDLFAQNEQGLPVLQIEVGSIALASVLRVPCRY